MTRRWWKRLCCRWRRTTLIQTRSGHWLIYILLTCNSKESIVKSVFSTCAQSRSALAVLDGVLGPHGLHFTPVGVLVSMKFRKQRTRQGEGPWRVLCQLKKLFKGPRRRRGSCWEELHSIVFPRWWVFYLPSRQINDFSQKGNLVARPDSDSELLATDRSLA